MSKMFDATKFDGDKITKEEFGLILECRGFLGVYQVKRQYDEDGEEEYVISNDEPTGKLVVFRDENGETVVMYCDNDVETSQLIDLL